MRAVLCGVLLLPAIAGCAPSDDGAEVPETITTVAREPEPNELRREDAAAGWIKLFDGESLFGWMTPTGDWRIDDRALVSDGGTRSVLTTTTEFADYELRWESWVGESTAGAVALRTASDPEGSGPSGYEIPLSGGEPQAGGRSSSPPNAWTKHAAIVTGSLLKVMSGAGGESPELTGEFPPEAVAGRISLVAEAGPVRIRSLYLKPLGTVQLFNGQDLAGWHDVPGGRAKFEPIVRGKESRLYVHQGGGYLETDETFSDFLLQAEVSFNGQGYDSGIVIRSPAGTAEAPANGYEVQLNNETRADDRSQPLDHGTGGLYGLVPARRQVSQNFFWFVPTIVAHGNHIAVWVNGEQVTDFTDTRDAAESARDGARSTGHLGLQASGDTVDIYFKTISIARLPTER